MPRRKRVCPLSMPRTNVGDRCLGRRCMWYVDGECAVTVIARHFKRKDLCELFNEVVKLKEKMLRKKKEMEKESEKRENE